MPNKFNTALSLLARGDFRGIRKHVALNLRRARLRLAGGKPFVHRRLGFDFPCFPGSHDSREIFLNGTTDGLGLSLVMAWMDRGDTAIDLGANLGIYACAAAQAAGNSAKVLAVEPSPALAAQIKEGARLLALAAITVREVCVGQQAGETEFFVAAEGKASGEQSRQVEAGRESDFTRTTARMETLDQLLFADLGGSAPSFVKMDVEGAEVQVLLGAGQTLASPDRACWLVEINPAALRRFGASPGELLRFFPSTEFDRWLIPQYLAKPAGSSRPRPLDDGEPFEDALYYDLVALPRDGRWASRSVRLRGLLAAG
jgi:FkbM family methyltransferase